MSSQVIVFMIHVKFNKFNMLVMSMYQHLHTHAPQVVSLVDFDLFLHMLHSQVINI